MPLSPREDPLVHRAVVIDDEFLICAQIEDVLRERGIETRTAADDVALPALVDDFAPQVIFLDIRLGRSDAFEIMRKSMLSRYEGIVCLLSGSPLDFLLDASAIGSELGLWMGPALKKPVEEADILDALHAVDLMLASRSLARERRQAGGDVAARSRLTVRDGLQQGRLEVWYQPTFTLATQALTGAEALVRGRTEEGAIVGPGELFTGATQQDLLDLTAFVLPKAIADSRTLADGGTPLKLSVNVPTSFLAEADPAAFVRDVSGERWWPGMILEVTEDEALANLKAVAQVALQLKLYAVELSIDDFGAGYSSLARLRDLPFAELKLDRSFVHGCASDSTKLAICKSVLTLGAELGCTTVAEGIEDEEDLRLVTEIGCDKVQGFRFARPMPFSDLLAMLSPAGDAAAESR
ncbi:EAL domain-containing protein [Jiella sp. M17.18]|uniref:EAL domain-containing response regulator n=1 Tax=Jiella sp. M17.18 TaxID=3234247 RepID=UPI0034DDEC1B